MKKVGSHLNLLKKPKKKLVRFKRGCVLLHHRELFKNGFRLFLTTEKSVIYKTMIWEHVFIIFVEANAVNVNL